MSIPPGVKEKRINPSGATLAGDAILLDARSQFCLIFYSVGWAGQPAREHKTED